MFKQYSESKALKKLACRNDIYAAHKVSYIYGEKHTHTHLMKSTTDGHVRIQRLIIVMDKVFNCLLYRIKVSRVLLEVRIYVKTLTVSRTFYTRHHFVQIE